MNINILNSTECILIINEDDDYDGACGYGSDVLIIMTAVIMMMIMKGHFQENRLPP